MLTFTLVLSCLTTSSLPWFVDLTFQISMQYCSLQHQTLLLSPVTSTAGYYFCFGSIILSGVICSLTSSSIWAPTDLGSTSFSILPFCLFILFMGLSRQEYWSGLPFPFPALSTFCQLSPPWPAHLGLLQDRNGLSFIELDKAVVIVWLDWLVFCEYGFSVSALCWPLATPTIFLEFLLPWASRLLQQSTAAAPYLGWGVSPPAALPDLQVGWLL